jgi:molybdopterin-guanine dinucleotide biosynthesis protein A
MTKIEREWDREYGGGPLNGVRSGARELGPAPIVLIGACPIFVGARKETL